MHASYCGTYGGIQSNEKSLSLKVTIYALFDRYASACLSQTLDTRTPLAPAVHRFPTNKWKLLRTVLVTTDPAVKLVPWVAHSRHRRN
jgi:hypothetical protein